MYKCLLIWVSVQANEWVLFDCGTHTHTHTLTNTHTHTHKHTQQQTHNTHTHTHKHTTHNTHTHTHALKNSHTHTHTHTQQETRRCAFFSPDPKRLRKPIGGWRAGRAFVTEQTAVLLGELVTQLIKVQFWALKS